jgi:hypothetical protein
MNNAGKAVLDTAGENFKSMPLPTHPVTTEMSFRCRLLRQRNLLELQYHKVT